MIICLIKFKFKKILMNKSTGTETIKFKIGPKIQSLFRGKRQHHHTNLNIKTCNSKIVHCRYNTFYITYRLYDKIKIPVCMSVFLYVCTPISGKISNINNSNKH